MLNQMIKPFLAAVVLAIAVAGAPASGSAFNNQEAASFLSNLQERAVAELTDASIGEGEKEQRFRTLFNESFDVPAIGRFVIGRYWRGASEEDRAAFLKVFEDVIVQRFLPLLTDNSDKRFEIGRVTPDSKKPNIGIIDSAVPRAEGEPYKVGWRVREKDGSYKILDIVAEGASMVITLRSEYNSVIKRSGGKLSALTADLRAKVDHGAMKPPQ